MKNFKVSRWIWHWSKAQLCSLEGGITCSWVNARLHTYQITLMAHLLVALRFANIWKAEADVVTKLVPPRQRNLDLQLLYTKNTLVNFLICYYVFVIKHEINRLCATPVYGKFGSCIVFARRRQKSISYYTF